MNPDETADLDAWWALTIESPSRAGVRRIIGASDDLLSEGRFDACNAWLLRCPVASLDDNMSYAVAASTRAASASLSCRASVVHEVQQHLYRMGLENLSKLIR